MAKFHSTGAILLDSRAVFTPFLSLSLCWAATEMTTIKCAQVMWLEKPKDKYTTYTKHAASGFNSGELNRNTQQRE